MRIIHLMMMDTGDNTVNSTGKTRRSFLTTLGSVSIGAAISGRCYAKNEAPKLVTTFGVCTTYKDYPMLKKAGYGYVEERVRGILNPDQPDAKVQEVLDNIIKQGIQIHACNSFLPGSLKSTGDKANHEGVLKYADVAFQRAKKIGVKGIVFGSSGSRRLPNGFDRAKAERQFVELLKKMAPLAQAQGVEIWLEPLNRKEDNFINTQLQGASIIDQVGHPSLGMVCDIFHVARNEEPPSNISQSIKHIRHCHIAEKAKRSAPGMEKYDFTPYLKALKDGGYSGSMSMECGWKNMTEQAKDVREYVEGQIAALKRV